MMCLCFPSARHTGVLCGETVALALSRRTPLWTNRRYCRLLGVRSACLTRQKAACAGYSDPETLVSRWVHDGQCNLPQSKNTSLGYEINVAGSGSGTLQLAFQARLRQMLSQARSTPAFSAFSWAANL